jgi:hypothetical protein
MTAFSVNNPAIGRRSVSSMSIKRRVGLSLMVLALALCVVVVLVLSLAPSAKLILVLWIPALLLEVAGLIVSRERPYVVPPDDDE